MSGVANLYLNAYDKSKRNLRKAYSLSSHMGLGLPASLHQGFDFLRLKTYGKVRLIGLRTNDLGKHKV